MRFIFTATIFTIAFLLGMLPVNSQGKTENLIIVTLDGMRWQEVFKGIDPVLSADSVFTHEQQEMKQKFWADTEEERRKKLFPFVWETIAVKGQVFGNRKFDNKIDNANPFWFSYPGYNEIFTGNPDTSVNSNDKIYNKYENVLEYINHQKGFEGKVAVFSTWDVFPYILNAPRSKIYVNSGVDTIDYRSATLDMLNDMQYLSPLPTGTRPDVITYFTAREYLKTYKPRVLYIAFDETDHFAHEGTYDQYIGTAHAEDAMIADIWKTVQAIPQYRDKTTLLITCDHGRGDAVKSNWKHHGKRIADAHEIWFAGMGPDTKALGEQRSSVQLYQKQLAPTIARLLGLDFKPAHPVAAPIDSLFR